MEEQRAEELCLVEYCPREIPVAPSTENPAIAFGRSTGDLTPCERSAGMQRPIGGNMQYLIRSVVAGFVLLMAMCPGMAAQQARSSSDQVGRIMSLESAWNQAEVQHDTRAMGMLLGETFTYTDSDGSVMNKAEWLDLMRKETDTFEQLGNSKIEVYLYGNVALVTGRYRERVKMKRTTIVRSGRFIDVWIELRGEWKCIGGQATLILPSPAK